MLGFVLADVRWYFSFIISFAKILYSHLTSENLFFQHPSKFHATMRPEATRKIYTLMCFKTYLSCWYVYEIITAEMFDTTSRKQQNILMKYPSYF